MHNETSNIKRRYSEKGNRYINSQIHISDQYRKLVENWPKSNQELFACWNFTTVNVIEIGGFF